MNAIPRTAKILDKVCRFLYWVLIFFTAVLAIAVVILGVSVFKGTPLLKSTESYLLSFGNLELLLAPGVLTEILAPGFEPLLLAVMVLTLAAIPVLILELQTVRDILQPFIRTEPFHEAIAKGLHRLAILVVIDTVFAAVVTVLMDQIAQRHLDIHALFTDGAVFGERIITAGLANSVIDVSPLLFAGALYLLSKVFRYGQELQQLADETL